MDKVLSIFEKSSSGQYSFDDYQEKSICSNERFRPVLIIVTV